MRPTEAKTEAIREYERPKSKKQVRAFLGLAGYYRQFIPDFAGTTAEMSDLTKKEARSSGQRSWKAASTRSRRH